MVFQVNSLKNIFRAHRQARRWHTNSALLWRGWFAGWSSTFVRPYCTAAFLIQDRGYWKWGYWKWVYRMPISFICHYTLCHFLRHEEQEYCNDFFFFFGCFWTSISVYWSEWQLEKSFSSMAINGSMASCCQDDPDVVLAALTSCGRAL